MNVSPLGSAAFTGTDVAIDADRVASLLGFDSTFTASYEAVAGAEHFMRLAGLHARISSTGARWRSEEHTSELQSRGHLVCRLLLEKKKKSYTNKRVNKNVQIIKLL